MSDYYTDEIQKRMDALPADIKALVYSADMGAVIHSIGQKYQLHVDQIGALESETAAVMIGLTEPSEFVQELVDALSVEQPKAEAIAQDINNELFIKIRESLKKVGSTPPPTAAPIATPASVAASTPAVNKIPVRVIPQTPIAAPTVPATAPTPAPKPVAPAPISVTPTTIPPTPMPAAPVAPKAPSMPAVETALTQPTVAVPPPAPAGQAPGAPKPIYKSDPYREPVE